ncbi:Citrate lyase subunit beta [Geodia barretti]|uniref:Citrate lyase subunit beta n=1 Tax=Geodia barretti TaxID=519541 RepID=A0AA35W2K6_GEOBA|nr:Citrate lyase subunit beta [Geodia barretti]
MLERALGFSADIIMVDLEDSVPLGEKAAACELATEWVPRLAEAGKQVMVRVNALETGLAAGELSAVVSADLSGISIGKGNTPWDVQQVDKLLAPLESRIGIETGNIKVIPWIETAMSIVHVYEMARASQRTVGIAFGAEDYTNDMGIIRSDFGEECYFARSTVAVAARAAGVAGLDGPFVGFRDPEGLKTDAGAARRMGYTGKFAIHPAQIDAINETFSPNPEDVAYAKRVVEAWDEAEAAGRGSLSIDGRMVDVPVVKRAQNLLAQAAAIEAQTN